MRAITRSLLPLLGITCLAYTGASAAGSFDGVYRGTQQATGTNNSANCAKIDHDTALRIENNHFTRTWSVPLSVDVAADGSFSASAIASQRPLRTAQITGKITGGNLEADIGTDLCRAHLSLKKA